jgi:hypothetical protein
VLKRCVKKDLKKKKKKQQTYLTYPAAHPFSAAHLLFFFFSAAGPPLFPGPTATAARFTLSLSPLADTAVPPAGCLLPPAAAACSPPADRAAASPASRAVSPPLHRATRQCAVPRARTASPLPLPPRRTEPHHHSWRPPVCPRPHRHAVLSSSPSTL